MSAFSKQDDTNTKLPDIGNKIGQGGLADIYSPVNVNQNGQPESPMRRSFSPTKTMFGGSNAPGTMTNFYFK